MSGHSAESDALRERLRLDAEASAKRPAHEKRYMPAIARALRRAADALEAQPPKLRAQYVGALRLYADEPWRLESCGNCGDPIDVYRSNCCHVDGCQECVFLPTKGESA